MTSPTQNPVGQPAPTGPQPQPGYQYAPAAHFGAAPSYPQWAPPPPTRKPVDVRSVSLTVGVLGFVLMLIGVIANLTDTYDLAIVFMPGNFLMASGLIAFLVDASLTKNRG